jgi:hypothetical protein
VHDYTNVFTANDKRHWATTLNIQQHRTFKLFSILSVATVQLATLCGVCVAIAEVNSDDNRKTSMSFCSPYENEIHIKYARKSKQRAK